MLQELQTDLERAKKGKPSLKDADGKPRNKIEKIAQTYAKIEKMEQDKETKEDLKTVALGTSKINYLDPRITVVWCKRHEVPIEKVMASCIVTSSEYKATFALYIYISRTYISDVPFIGLVYLFTFGQ